MAGEPILIVDDNATNLKLARVVLQMEGYEVRTAMDADEALGILKEFRPALILMDLQLPGMDGLTLTRKIKSGDGGDGIRIVAMTAYAMKGDEDRALAGGCDGYIAKPIDTRRLAGQIAQFLRPPSSGKDPAAS